MIKAIETEYGGHLFRSRLEARWAVFFDALSIEWKYEPQGFENEFGDRYLPDFYLPATDTWVEVKGDPKALCDQWDRMASIVGGLPGFEESKHSRAGLLLLGDIPAPKSRGVFVHPIVQHRQGFVRTWCFFFPPPTNQDPDGIAAGPYPLGELGILGQMLGVSEVNGLEKGPEGWSVESKHLDIPIAFRDVPEAYDRARMARFEHGARGYAR